ncbi:MAG: hypothetical protein QHI38_10180, partial [Armatimonadota bacterium]|nr:hypothetical protein [Armatimonadota bacterium]
KMLADGSPVLLYGKVVTANFSSSDGCIYIEEPTRTAGIRVETADSSLRPGDIVNVSGKLATRMLSGRPSERTITSAVVSKVASAAGPKAVALTCKNVGGSDFNSFTPGVRNGVGLNNMGLLVRVFGRVTYVAGNYIYVDDGSKVENLYGLYTPVRGVMVKCPGTPSVNVGDMVGVTGVVEGSIPSSPDWTTNRVFIQMRDWSDLTRY